MTGCGPVQPVPTDVEPAKPATDTAGEFLPDLFEADIGTVSFPVSCSEQAARVVERGVALLHHMMYENARLVFGMAENLDPECAMAVWGQAMVMIHPMWPDRPTPDEIGRGRELAGRALAVGAATPRETAYLATAWAYFADEIDETEQDRLNRFAEAWRRIAEQHPEDLEAQAFYALAHLATADLNDKSYQKNLLSGQIAHSILERVPDHPGAHHYLIHAYDNPLLADRALPVADRYGALAPAVPHATHMMTHIYTRLGLWEKSIEWNARSADAAWEICVELGEILPHYQHALDYKAYAHLQIGEDSKALAIVDDIGTLEAPFSSLNPASAAYAFAALPSRYHLERQDWQAATELPMKSPASFPWDSSHDAYLAIVRFARAIGYARLDRTEEAKLEIGELEALHESVARSSSYWAQQIRIQIIAASAWMALTAGEADRALELMEEAADLEAATEKSATSPGEVLPAAELLGDMHYQRGDYRAALAAYERSLARTPGRLLSLYGAARSAEAAGLDAEAVAHYQATLATLSEQTERHAIRQQALRYLEG